MRHYVLGGRPQLILRPFIVVSLCFLQVGHSVATMTREQGQVSLSHVAREGDVQFVRVVFEVDGNLRLRTAANEQAVTTPVRVKAELAYDERFVEVGSAARTVRYYDTAEAVIAFREGSLRPTLREERNVVACAVSAADQGVLYSPLGPLTRDELDLITVPANSAVIQTLLPQRAVAQGEKWKVTSDFLPAIVGLDAVGKVELECTLDRVDAEQAIVHASGTVEGTAHGVVSEMVLAAKYRYDRRQQRITWLAMNVKEKRAIGHAHPGVEATARVQMTLQPKADSSRINADWIAQLDLQPSPPAKMIEFESPEGGFGLLLDRAWHVMIERRDVSVLRLVDRGDLIAQCNISALPPLDEGIKFTLIDFQQDIRRVLDKRLGEFITASESVNDNGLHLMRVVVHGQVSDLPIEWVYYHLSDDQGRRASFVCTYEASLAERFGGADHTLVGSFRFLEASSGPAVDSVQRPSSSLAPTTR